MKIRKYPAGRDELARLFKGTGVEVGTEEGRYAQKIAEVCTKLYCVDRWSNYEGYREHVDSTKYEQIYQKAKGRLAKYNCELIREDSLTAVQRFEDNSLDFCYIDSNHEYLFVVHDLYAWFPKVRRGGIIAGHDFSGKHGKGVKKAVLEFCAAKGIEELKEWCGDKAHSFHFIKPKV